MKVQIKSAGRVVFDGDFDCLKTALLAAVKAGADLSGADLFRANLSGANLFGADLIGADLFGADLFGADGKKLIVAKIHVFSGLYKYQVWSVLTNTGECWVRMGCLFHSVEEWEKIGIKKSNVRQFPDDGSFDSEVRAMVFEFAKSYALKLKE